jgi:hypothetical protein
MGGREEARQCYEGGDVEADLAVDFFFGHFRKFADGPKPALLMRVLIASFL